MNTQPFRRLSIGKKILYIFFAASFIPILCLAYFSSNYVKNILEEDTHINLLKHAKSYGLFTFEKLSGLNEQLNTISQQTNNTLPNNVISEFEKVELLDIENIYAQGFGKSKNTKLRHYHDENNKLVFTFEKLHIDTNQNYHILRAGFSINTLFGGDSENPFSEPVCIFTESGSALFCNENVALKNAALKNVGQLLQSNQHIIQHTFNQKEYVIASWELFLPSNFQSETWYFMVIKPQSVALEAIKKLNQIIIPLSLVFFLLIAYALFIFIRKLMWPLKMLTEATHKISQGSYQDIDLNVKTNDEFKELSDSFTLMTQSLFHQHTKDEVFSQLEQSVLSCTNIHSALKENIPDIAKLIDLKWLVVSFIDADDTTRMHSHCIVSKNNKADNYAYLKHKSFDFESNNNLFFSITHDQFKENFSDISAAFSSRTVWIKKLTLGQRIIGALFMGTNNNTPLTSLNTAVLIELSERFSTIYTTYKQRSELMYKAHYDALTKLSNRSHLLEKLREKWPEAIENNSNLSIIYIDLDNFKNVNDLSGHKAGNQVLSDVAKRLESCIDDNSLLARLSGDEFCILYTNENNAQESTTIAKNIIKLLEKPFAVKDMSFFLGASIGIATGPQNCSSPESLIERADLAMYKAKQDGKNHYVVYNTEIEEERNYRLSLEHFLHFAIKNNEISLKYQPKIDLTNGKVTSVECLARWHQHELGFIPTDKFITLAEESGMIIEIGAWILRKSCYQFVDWLEKNIVLDSIAVNVSARQLASRNFSTLVASVIKETGIPAHCLDLEITESAFINDESLLNDELSKLHALGVKISIDDFGKEYSSLSYLKKIPFDTLKIDREFIIDLESDHRDQHIIDVIINIGHTLGKKIVAEGIETINQRDILRRYGCDIGQGYLFSRPLSEIEFLEFSANYINNGIETETLEALQG